MESHRALLNRRTAALRLPGRMASSSIAEAATRVADWAPSPGIGVPAKSVDHPR